MGGQQNSLTPFAGTGGTPFNGAIGLPQAGTGGTPMQNPFQQILMQLQGGIHGGGGGGRLAPFAVE
jgi:hypothetical protein